MLSLPLSQSLPSSSFAYTVVTRIISTSSASNGDITIPHTLHTRAVELVDHLFRLEDTALTTPNTVLTATNSGVSSPGPVLWEQCVALKTVPEARLQHYLTLLAASIDPPTCRDIVLDTLLSVDQVYACVCDFLHAMITTLTYYTRILISLPYK